MKTDIRALTDEVRVLEREISVVTEKINNYTLNKKMAEAVSNDADVQHYEGQLKGLIALKNKMADEIEIKKKEIEKKKNFHLEKAAELKVRADELSKPGYKPIVVHYCMAVAWLFVTFNLLGMYTKSVTINGNESNPIVALFIILLICVGFAVIALRGHKRSRESANTPELKDLLERHEQEIAHSKGYTIEEWRGIQKNREEKLRIESERYKMELEEKNREREALAREIAFQTRKEFDK